MVNKIYLKQKNEGLEMDWQLILGLLVLLTLFVKVFIYVASKLKDTQ